MEVKHTVLRELLDHEVVDEGVMLVLVNARVEMLKPFMQYFTMNTLGDMRLCGHMNQDDSHCKQIKDDEPTVTTPGFSLRTQGLFWAEDVCMIENDTLYIFGLTRQYKWIIAEVHTKDCENFSSGYMKKALEIVVKASDPIEIADRFPLPLQTADLSCLMFRLDQAVYAWEEKYKQMAVDAEGLASAVRFDNLALQYRCR